jgi:hypothetical protein
MEDDLEETEDFKKNKIKKMKDDLNKEMEDDHK